MRPIPIPVTVIIPTYKRQSILCATLRSVLEQDYPDFEILVIDQTPGVAPELSHLLERHPEKIRYHRQEQPNLAKARNRGVALSTTESIIFLDDDVILSPRFIEHHVRRLNASARTAAVTGPTPPNMEEHESSTYADLHERYEFGLLPEERGQSCFRASWFPGCNFSIKRSALAVAGPFDESFTGTAYGEETDMGVRLKSLGFELMYDCNAWLIHLFARTGGCETRNPEDAARREVEIFHHTLYSRMKHSTFEGPGKTARQLYNAYRSFVLNKLTLRRGPRYALRRLESAIAETTRAYTRLRLMQELDQNARKVNSLHATGLLRGAEFGAEFSTGASADFSA